MRRRSRRYASPSCLPSPPQRAASCFPDRLSLPVWPTSSRGRWARSGASSSPTRAPYYAALAAGVLGGTTPLAAGLAARRVQADLAVLVEAKANGTELKITGTPVLPESGRGKVPSHSPAGHAHSRNGSLQHPGGVYQAGLEALALKPTPTGAGAHRPGGALDRVARGFSALLRSASAPPIASVEAYDRAIKALRRSGGWRWPQPPPVDPEFALAHAALAEAAALEACSSGSLACVTSA